MKEQTSVITLAVHGFACNLCKNKLQTNLSFACKAIPQFEEGMYAKDASQYPGNLLEE